MIQPYVQRVAVFGKRKLGLHLARKVNDDARFVAILAKTHIGYRRVLGHAGGLDLPLAVKVDNQTIGPAELHVFVNYGGSAHQTHRCALVARKHHKLGDGFVLGRGLGGFFLGGFSGCRGFFGNRGSGLGKAD